LIMATKENPSKSEESFFATQIENLSVSI